MVLQLNVEKREVFGKKLKKSREEGKLPVVLYGVKIKETTSFFVDLSEFKKVWKEAGESSVIELKEGDKKIADVMVHDLATHSIRGDVLHVDFLAVDMNKLIVASIPLVFEGTAPAEKNLGGILVKVIHELEVEALPDNLPHEIVIDVTKLETFDDRITPADIKLPADVTMVTKEDEVIALAELPKEEEVEERSIEDIEVEQKGKKEEEGEETSTENA